MHLSHDPACKRLFAYPELVRALLMLVPGCPVEMVTPVERVNCSFVSTSDRQRYADMVWRVDGPSGVFYVLLEFQSTIDPQMDQRMQVYAGLLSQDLHAQHRRELFALLPVVVYSGRRKWSQLPDGNVAWLRTFQEGKTYLLVDEAMAGGSIIGDVIRLVRGSSLAQVVSAANAILARDVAGEDLRREVCHIARERATALGGKREVIMDDRVKRKRKRELSMDEKSSALELFLLINETMKDMPEVRRLIKAREEAKREGAMEGREQGLQEGRQKGLQEGLKKGLQEGRLAGKADALRCVLARYVEPIGATSPAQDDRIARADATQLEAWIGQLIAGAKLDSVLGEGGPCSQAQHGPGNR